MESNILLIILDSVRAKNTSLHGYHKRTTPFLQEFSRESIQYSQARAPGNWSLPSHVSMFTGAHVEEHGITRSKDELKDNTTIIEELKKNGYRTGVFSSNSWLTQMEVGLKNKFEDVFDAASLYPFEEYLSPDQLILDPGFGGNIQYLREAIQSDSPTKSIINGISKKISFSNPKLLPEKWKSNTSAETYSKQFLEWEGNRKSKWFACLNLMDAHLPYQPESEHNKWGDQDLEAIQNKSTDHKWQYYSGNQKWWRLKALEALYDGAIHQMDTEIERIYDELERRGSLEDTLIIITSDHGECFGEPSRIRPNLQLAAHGIGYHESLLHVPLLVNLPKSNTNIKYEAPVSLTSIPTIIQDHLAGEFEPESIAGQKVVGYTDGLVEPDEEHAKHYCEDVNKFLGEQWTEYEEENGSVVKKSYWDSNSEIRIGHKIAIYSPWSAEKIGRISKEDVFSCQSKESKFKIEGKSIKEESDEVKQRLEDLGYM